MKELYKVREITISLLDRMTHEPFLDIPCEFGVIIEKEGILFFETHIFNNDDSAKFNYSTLGCPACAKMYSFDGIEIEVPFMAFTNKSSKENTVGFRCFNYITIYEEDVLYAYQKSEDPEMKPSQLLRVDLWGLDLLITQLSTSLIICDAPFEMEICSDEDSGVKYIQFLCNKDVAHNTLTEDLFEIFRNSLVGYLSLINGARVQITKEYYNGFFRLFSYNKIENTCCSYYACGNAKVYRPFPILYEFDNYIRWNQILDFNKFIYHLCSAQQEINYEESAFILILVFEGLCKKYIDIHDKEIVSRKIIPNDSFEKIKKDLNEIVDKHKEISAIDITRFKEAVNRLNDAGLATYKFYLILDELNIQRTKEIVNLIKRVRPTLVHEAEVKDYSDYVLLSELIREIILRLICSTVERHSDLEEKVILGEAPNLSFHKFIEKNKLTVKVDPIFDEFDSRIKLRIKNVKYNKAGEDARIGSCIE